MVVMPIVIPTVILGSLGLVLSRLLTDWWGVRLLLLGVAAVIFLVIGEYGWSAFAVVGAIFAGWQMTRDEA